MGCARDQRWSRGHKARGQGQGHKKIRGQGQPFRGQTLSRPRTQAQVLSKKKKKKKVFTKIFQAISKKKRSSQKFFKRSPQKNVFQKIFQALHEILTIQKVVLSSSRGQANFRGFEASRPRTSKCVLEAKDVLEDSTSARDFIIVQEFNCFQSDLVNIIFVRGVAPMV